MKDIIFLHDGSPFTSRFLFPLRLTKHLFREAGYRLRWLPFRRVALTPEAHCVVVLHDCLESAPEDLRVQVLSALREKCDRLVWLDTSDSTGTTLFEVMPLVDRYLKKQVLKDRELYRRPLYSLRFYSEYYHNRFGIEDEPIPSRAVLDKEHDHKLCVAWNILIGDVLNNGRPPAERLFGVAGQRRGFHLSYRGSLGYLPTVEYQRQKIGQILARHAKVTKPDGTTSVPHRQYLEEMRNSQAVLSPFGWGEICWRDAEAFICGAALVKPDMSHLDTWPVLYQSGVTYLPLSWDLSDLDRFFEELTADPLRLIPIAVEGQAAYRRIISESGRCAFVTHVLESLGETTTADRHLPLGGGSCLRRSLGTVFRFGK